MEKSKQKFKAYSETLGVSDAYTLFDLITKQTDFEKYDTYLQYTGFNDANKTEVYEGDVLELVITPELMSHETNTFFNSNLGKCIEKEGDITSVLLVLEPDKPCKAMDYVVYFCRNGKLERNASGEPKWATFNDDKLFPQYLCNKGATVVGNIAVNKTFLDNR